MSERFYHTAAWRKLRAAIIARDPICRTPGCGQPSTHADHIKPRRQGGSDDPSNLRGLCSCCNARVTRQGNRKPLRAPGCNASGTPNDPRHWWRR
jgi:5-methylcytosine-specific restriction endonuclease McrA